MSKIIVIGAGASGLIASIYASKNNEVTILEKNNICGKKILMTGNGRCNYFNDNFDIKYYHSSNIDILNNIITNDNKNKVITFFDKLGVIPKIRDGYYYPYSNQASTIQSVLLKEVKNSNVKIINNVIVSDIKKDNNLFNVYTNNGKYTADKVILAVGSKACPITGSTGDGYNILSKLGLNIIKPLPALVQLKGDFPFMKEWSGIRSDVIVSLLENDKKISEEKGEIQLTNYGISGICVFQLSSLISRGLDLNKKEDVLINFMPYLNDLSFDEKLSFFDKRSKSLKNYNILEFLEGMLNYKLVKVILKFSEIKENAFYENLNDKQKSTLINNLTSFIFNVNGTNSFENAQVCSGGVCLNDVNINSMEVKKIPGLYVIGELLDVDGNCGGYNLGFAWISGMLAGENI